MAIQPRTRKAPYFTLWWGTHLGGALKLDITDTGGDVATFTESMTTGSLLVKEFLAFDNAANVDFAHVKNIKMTIAGPAALDVNIKLVETGTVPEPTTLAIWSLLGGIGLVVGHRRRKRKAA